jgi:hypothetical protein
VLKAIEVDRAFSDELVQDISRHVAAIGGDLDWELSAGTTAKHAFCVSAKGDTELRVVTELWRSLGPPADETWQYYSARQPAPPGFRLRFDDVDLDVEDMRVAFEIDATHARVHGTYFHPGFHKLEDPGPALFVMLDNAFGEDGVERWLGGIELATELPSDAQPLQAVRGVVERLAAKASEGPRYTMLEGTANGEPIFLTLNLGLKRIDHLLHTTHVAVEVAVLDRGDNGMPTKGDLQAMAALEDELTSALGNTAVYFGRETTQSHRTMHWYAPEDSAAKPTIERWVKQNATRRASARFEHDPKWQFVKQF